MRILEVHWAFPPTTGGVESHVADLSGVLARRGCDVVVLTGEREPVPQPGVDVVPEPLLDLATVQAVGDARHTYRAQLDRIFGSVIERFRPDVVHGHNLHHFAAEPALVLDALRSEFSFAMHHTFHETWPDVLKDTPVYKAWEGNYTVSRHVQNDCEQRIGFRPELLPLGIDTARFHADAPPMRHDGPTIILHPARLLPWKGVHVSVEMLGELRDRGLDARLVLTDTSRITDWNSELGAYRRRILSAISSLGLNDDVELRAVAYSEMGDLYRAADIVVYPTVGQEPYGLVPLEAMSSLRPVVTTRSGGLCETVVDGSTGFIVEPGDAIALANRVARLMRDPALAERLGRRGRERVLARYSLERHTDSLLDRFRVRR